MFKHFSKVFDDVLNCVCSVLDVVVGQAGDRNSTIASHINVVLLDHLFALFWGQAQEGEHTNL